MLIVHYLHGEEGKSHTKTRRHKEDWVWHTSLFKKRAKQQVGLMMLE